MINKSFNELFLKQHQKDWKDKSLSELEGNFVVDKIQNFGEEFCKDRDDIDWDKLSPQQKIEIDQKLENLAKAYYNDLATREYDEDLSKQSKKKKIGKIALMAGVSMSVILGTVATSQIPGAEQYIKFISKFLLLGIPTAKAVWMSIKMKRKYKKCLDTAVNNNSMPNDLKLILEDELLAQVGPEKNGGLLTGIRRVEQMIDTKTEKLEKKRWWGNMKKVFGKKDVIDSPFGVSSLAFMSRNILRSFTRSNTGLISGLTVGVIMGATKASGTEWKKAVLSLRKSIDEDIKNDRKDDENSEIPEDRIKNYLRFLDSTKLAKKDPILYKKLGALVKKHLKSMKDLDFFMDEKDQREDYENDRYFEAKAIGVDVKNFRNKFSTALTHITNTVTSVDENDENKKRKFDKKKLLGVGIQGGIGASFGLAMDKFSGFANNLFKHDEVDVKIDYAKDTDGDGLPDEYEKVIGTDINKIDSDGDGISDSQELQDGTNPTDSNSYMSTETNEGAAINVDDETGKVHITIQDENHIVGNVYEGGRTYIMGKLADELGIDVENLTPKHYAKIILATDYAMDHHPSAHGNGANLEPFSAEGKTITFDKSTFENAVSFVNRNPSMVNSIAQKYANYDINLTLTNYNGTNLGNSFVNESPQMVCEAYKPGVDLETWQETHTNIDMPQALPDNTEDVPDGEKDSFEFVSWSDIGIEQKVITGAGILLSAVSSYLGAKQGLDNINIKKSKQVLVDVAKGTLNTATAAALLVPLGLPGLSFAILIVNLFKTHIIDVNRGDSLTTRLKEIKEDENLSKENIKRIIEKEISKMNNPLDKVIPVGNYFLRNIVPKHYLDSFISRHGVKFSDVEFLKDQKIDKECISNDMFDVIQSAGGEIDTETMLIKMKRPFKINIDNEQHIFQFIPLKVIAGSEKIGRDGARTVNVDRYDSWTGNLKKAIEIFVNGESDFQKSIMRKFISRKLIFPRGICTSQRKNLYIDGVKFNSEDKRLKNMVIVQDDRNILFSPKGYEPIEVKEDQIKLETNKIVMRRIEGKSLEDYLIDNLQVLPEESKKNGIKSVSKVINSEKDPDKNKNIPKEDVSVDAEEIKEESLREELSVIASHLNNIKGNENQIKEYISYMAKKLRKADMLIVNKVRADRDETTQTNISDYNQNLSLKNKGEGEYLFSALKSKDITLEDKLSGLRMIIYRNLGIPTDEEKEKKMTPKFEFDSLKMWKTLKSKFDSVSRTKGFFASRKAKKGLIKEIIKLSSIDINLTNIEKKEIDLDISIIDYLEDGASLKSKWEVLGDEMNNIIKSKSKTTRAKEKPSNILYVNWKDVNEDLARIKRLEGELKIQAKKRLHEDIKRKYGYKEGFKSAFTDVEAGVLFGDDTEKSISTLSTLLKHQTL